MKRHCLLLIAMAWVLPVSGAEPAQVTLFCNSLRFSPATTDSQTLSFTTDSNSAQPNGELAAVSNPSLPGYGALFLLADPTSVGDLTGQIYFDTPPPTDANGDGFDDFLQVSQAVAPTTTQGLFTTLVDSGTVTATWSRAAGLSTGACSVQMTGKTFGQLPSFTFTFELLTYMGALAYSPTSSSTTGFLNLTNVESSSDTLTGPVSLIRVAGTNRFNDLTLLPGTLTNSAGTAFRYLVEDIQRDTNLQTNYYGYFDFADSNPTTSTSGYLSWTISINDPNDANGNGIPDLSDDPGAAVPPLRLNLTRSANDLLLAVSGVSGASYNLEEIVSLQQTNWQKTASIVLTNNPQTVTLALPDTSTKFWRLRAP